MEEKTSAVSGFYKLPPDERRAFVANFASLTDEERKALEGNGLPLEQANRIIENVIGIMPVPLGIATNFLINGKEILVPMAIEEASVVAAASNMAKIARVKGGFRAESSEPIMIVQIQLVAPDPEAALKKIISEKQKILSLANEKDPTLIKYGGGARALEGRVVDSPKGKMVVIHLLVDVRDAMGANIVNTMAEGVSPYIEQITGGKVYLRIVSNLAVHRTAKATAVFDKEALGGEAVVDAILWAYNFAVADQYRCTTHNKGVMNGVTAVVLATGNDTRAVEAGAHSFAARNGRIAPLTNWEKNADGDLVGSIELPVAVGVVGGVTSIHPVAIINRKILGVKTSRELGEVLASVGLAQNLAAIKALATEGIQRGHMGLHARNIAAMAGAKGGMIDRVAEILVKEKKVKMDRAKEVIAELEKTG